MKPAKTERFVVLPHRLAWDIARAYGCPLPRPYLIERPVA